MTINVDFYLIAESHRDGRNRFACRLLEKAYHHHHNVLVLCDDDTTAHTIDELLWIYTDTSFIPHNLLGEGPTPAPPIQIGTHVVPQHRDILLLLTSEIPAEFKQFKRIIEIICCDDEAKKNAREHYRYFREQGCQLVSHDLQKEKQTE